MTQRMMILGATSKIAEETARVFAAKGATFHLVGRDGVRLKAQAQDLVARGAAAVTTAAHDLGEVSEHDGLLAAGQAALGTIDIVLMAYGTLGNQAVLAADYRAVEEHLRLNLLSALSLIMKTGVVLEGQRRGTLAVITSVAGDRGRASNFVYGTGKGAVTLFLSGMRGKLRSAGVHVMTIKPGMVDTPMIQGLRKGALTADPALVGQAIAKGIETRRQVLYVPWFWRYIMAVIKALPEAVMMRLKF